MNSTLIIIAALIVALAALGAYLRWAVGPVAVAYRCGSAMGHRVGRSDRQLLIRALANVINERDALAAACGQPSFAEKRTGTGPQPAMAG
jgi:hypothetical protein